MSSLVRTYKPLLVVVADAMVTELNEAANEAYFIAPFVAERSYADWDERLPELDEKIWVDVVPVDYNPLVSGLASRGDYEHQIRVDVGVRYKFPDKGVLNPEDNKIEQCEVDKFVLLTEQISEFFLRRKLKYADEFVWEQTELMAAFSREHLRELRQYLGLVRMTFVRDRGLMR